MIKEVSVPDKNLFPWCSLAEHGGCGSCSFATLVLIKQRALALETVHLLAGR